MRIAPPEAPSTGYNFGKGVYFADLADKSVGYACTGLSKGIGLFVVCEVALGNPQQFRNPNYDAAKLAPGCHSTHAVGRRRPQPSGSTTFEKEIEVPMGTVENFPEGGMGANEWVVYNTN